MKLPSFKRLYKNDYPAEQQQIIEALSSSINIGMESIYDALDRKLTFSDNFLGTTKDVTVELSVDGAPKITTGFALDSNTTIQGLLVIRAENLTNTNIYPSGGILVSYKQNSNNIIINHITGLQANNKYRLKIIALG